MNVSFFSVFPHDYYLDMSVFNNINLEPKQMEVFLIPVHEWESTGESVVRVNSWTLQQTYRRVHTNGD